MKETFKHLIAGRCLWPVVGILFCLTTAGCVVGQRHRFVEVRNASTAPITLYVDGVKASETIRPGAIYKTPRDHLRSSAMRLEARDAHGTTVLQRIDLIDETLDRADDGTTVRAVFGGVTGSP